MAIISNKSNLIAAIKVVEPIIAAMERGEVLNLDMLMGTIVKVKMVENASTEEVTINTKDGEEVIASTVGGVIFTTSSGMFNNKVSVDEFVAFDSEHAIAISDYLFDKYERLAKMSEVLDENEDTTQVVKDLISMKGGLYILKNRVKSTPKDKIKIKSITSNTKLVSLIKDYFEVKCPASDTSDIVKP